jgi:hypothetical protein
LAPNADEGRGSLRKASGSREQALIRGYPNGETRGGEPTTPRAESIGVRREPGELKHLSTQRKREHFPSSGERKGSSPNLRSLLRGGCRIWHMGVTKLVVSRRVWDSPPKKVIVLYAKTAGLPPDT